MTYFCPICGADTQGQSACPNWVNHPGVNTGAGTMTTMTLEQAISSVQVRNEMRGKSGEYPNGEGWGHCWREDGYWIPKDAWKVIDAHLAKGAQEWQPIETAPRDGLPRLYLCNGKVIQGFVDATGSLCKQDELGWLPMRKNPTHWMPLPGAPMLSQRGEVQKDDDAL